VIAGSVLLKFYLLMIYAHGLNWVRTLGAHRYRNTGAEMSYRAQLQDSINMVGNPVVHEILFPVGLRYHALHHLFPTLPYHALGEAHRRLMAQLPEDSPYRLSNLRSFRKALLQLWRHARNSRVQGAGVMHAWKRAA